MDVWGVMDYWETPAEFFQKSGDCEDFAIAKYFALRDLGFPASQMRIVVLKDTLRNLAMPSPPSTWTGTHGYSTI